jgi:asparagine synthase (glutamine-hydrolysing)
MCGIAGFFMPGAGGDRRQLAAIGTNMHMALAHRGPDSADVWQDTDLPLVFAHRRLAIHDLTADGAQPMASPSGRYMIVYNGELYNYRELQAELQQSGQVFKTRCDTEILLAAIDHWGMDRAVQKFNGQYAIALWDRKDKQLHFIRDRFGKKPLYVGWAGKTLVFASELKAFHVHPDFTPELDRNVLALYMRFGYVCAPHAIFKNVWQILPGGRLSLDISSLQPGENLSRRMETYWLLRHAVEDARAHPVKGDEQAILKTFEEKLALAVKQRMDCDVPFGSFLSGGIDSSLVTAMMQKHSPRPVQTYSIGFDEAGYDESQAAARVAAHLGTDHREFRVGSQDVLDVIPRLADMFDEPFADASQIPTFLVSKLARQYVTVALTGDGGDEILGGYQRHTHIPALWNKISWMPPAVRRTAGNLMLRVPQQAYDRMKPAYPQFGRRVHRMAQVVAEGDTRSLYTSLLQVWPENEQVVPGATMPLIPLDDPACWPSDLSLAEKIIYADTLSYRPNDLMVKADRATMCVALEARAPLMDYELCEYSWRLPHEMKIRGLEGKWLLRRLLEKHVPKSLFERPKAGFNVPLHQWLKGPLKEWGESLLNPDRLKQQGLLNADLVWNRWQDFQNGRGGHANATDLWTALMFQSWHDRWMN